MKVIKGVGKLAKGIVKGVTKTFKKIMKSDIGKMLLLAAAVYTGGVALGAWGATGPLSFMHGSLAAGGAAGGGASLTAGATTGAGGAGITSSTLAGTSGIGAATNAAIAPQFASGITAAGAPAVTSAAVPTATKGIVGKVVGNTLNFAKENPITSAMALNAAAGAMSPDEIDLARENERIRLEKYKNMATGDINVKPTNQTLNYQDGRPVYSRGIIQRGMA